MLNLFKVDELSKIKGRTVYALRKGSEGMISGLEIPKHDGGGRFLVSDFQNRSKQRSKHYETAMGIR